MPLVPRALLPAGAVEDDPRLAPRIVVVAALGTAATFVEGLALVGVVRLAAAASAGSDTATLRLGPVGGEFSVIALAGAVGVALLVATTLQVAVAVLRGRLTASWGHRRRRRFVERHLAADHRARLELGAAGLQTLNTAVGQVAGAIDASVGAVKALASAGALALVAVIVQPLAALGLAVAGVLLHAGLRPLTGRSRALAAAQADTGLTYAHEIDELARLGRELAVFGSGRAFARRLDATSARFARLQRRARALSQSIAPLYQATTIAFATGVLVAVVAWGGTDAAQVGASAVLLLRGLAYGQQFQTAIHRLRETEPFADQVAELEGRLTPARVVFGDADCGPIESLTVENLAFHHPGAARPVTVDRLRCRRGEVVAVTGPSGEGKTTLAELLVRLRLPDRGEIRVNGLPHVAVHPDHWTRRVAFVPQNPPLVTGTLADNVDLWRGLPRATLVEAVARAGLADEVDELEAGLDTRVGPGGRNLSGGQLQRLALARALAGGPDLLVLDEPTSALDAASEERVRATLTACRASMIVIVITHRASTLAVADRHLVLRRGRLSETTTHDLVG